MANLQSVQRSWAAQPIATRLAVLSEVRGAIAAALDRWVGMVSACRGCSEAEALSSEVLPLLDALQFLERQANRILEPQRPDRKSLPYWLFGTELEIRRQPWGTVLILGPGNYPLFLPGVQAAQALAAGNAVQLKPQVGKEAPLQALAGLLAECGLPPGVLQVLDSSVASGQRAIEEGVDKIVLTGSLASGRAVRAAAGLTPLTSELSGADLVWVGPGADLDLVARAVRWGLSLNQGQTCMAPRRLFASAHDLAVLEGTLTPGAPPPILSGEHQALVDEALAGGGRWIGPDCLRATSQARLLTSSDPPPLLCLVAIADDEEGERLARSCPLGLGAALFGRRDWADSLSQHLRVGFVTINDLIAPTADPRLPFGGRQLSGCGVTRGAEGLLEMTVPQAVACRTTGPYYHLDPPSPLDYSILGSYTRFAHGRGPLSRAWSLLKMLACVGRERLRRRLGR